MVYEYDVTTIINSGNWESGNFSSIIKPVIKEILDDEELELFRLLIFKRIIITLQVTTTDFEKGFDRGKEATDSFDAFVIWIKDGTRSKMKGIYDKIRDIFIEDNDQIIYSVIDISEMEYIKERGRQIGKLGAICHKTSKSRI